jgi:hypothetical protein
LDWISKISFHLLDPGLWCEVRPRSWLDLLMFSDTMSNTSFKLKLNMMSNSDPSRFQRCIILIGREGCGKTTIFNRITKASTHEDLPHCCPCETGVTHSLGCCLHVIDPQSNGCSLHHGLTCGELNGIFILIEFHPRIGSALIDCKYYCSLCLTLTLV